MNLILRMHFCLIVKLHSSELDWRGSFLERRSEINIFWNYTSV